MIANSTPSCSHCNDNCDCEMATITFILIAYRELIRAKLLKINSHIGLYGSVVCLHARLTAAVIIEGEVHGFFDGAFSGPLIRQK